MKMNPAATVNLIVELKRLNMERVITDNLDLLIDEDPTMEVLRKQLRTYFLTHSADVTRMNTYLTTNGFPVAFATLKVQKLAAKLMRQAKILGFSRVSAECVGIGKATDPEMVRERFQQLELQNKLLKDRLCPLIGLDYGMVTTMENKAKEEVEAEGNRITEIIRLPHSPRPPSGPPSAVSFRSPPQPYWLDETKHKKNKKKRVKRKIEKIIRDLEACLPCFKPPEDYYMS